MSRISAGRLKALLHLHLYPTTYVQSSAFGGWFLPRKS